MLDPYWLGIAEGILAKVVDSLNPLFYPFLPYWCLVLVALVISPFTIVIPQWFSGQLSWPLKKDSPDVWIIYGKRYNLRPFFDQHPGGTWVLRAAKGSDCTGLFESYHTFMNRELLLEMVKRFEIDDGDEDDVPQPVMVYSDPFYEDLKTMVRDHFKGQPRGAHKMTTPHLFLSFSALITYWVMIYVNVVYLNTWLLILPIGFMSWYLTGNLMHDGSHNALVTTPWVNRVASHAAFPYGVNVAGWTIQHVLSHHIYPNLEEFDVDLYHFDPVMPLHKGKDKSSVHMVLHFIRLILLTSTSLNHLGFVVPYGLLFGQIDVLHGHAMYDRIKSIKSHRAELRWELALETVAQMIFWGWVFHHQGFIKGICDMMSIYCVASLSFSFFTQVSHLQEECHPDDAEWEKLSFAKRQVKTSVDFSPDSVLWGHLSGGLNTQAIHHCFPSVSAMHLRALYPKFRKVCEKHGVELKEAPSLGRFLMGYVYFSN